jgi:hypothetical protein
LIGLGGIVLDFISLGKQLFFSPDFVMLILTPLALPDDWHVRTGLCEKGIN